MTIFVLIVWMRALINAANGIGGPTTFNFDEYYALLSLDKTEELTTSALNKAYRKAALKNHPDKGGNVDAFKKVQEAFEILQSKLAEEEQSKFYKTIGFTAEIEKVTSSTALQSQSHSPHR
jgi:curved DNA-binding protein CbpA